MPEGIVWLCPPRIRVNITRVLHLGLLEPRSRRWRPTVGNPTISPLMDFGTGLALLGSDGRSSFLVPRYFRFVFALPGKRPLEARKESR